MNVNKKYLTAKEAAEYLGLTMQGIWKLAFNKKIRYYKPNGKMIYFAVSDIDNYVIGSEVFEPENKTAR
jgi:excisionase family DNA binding protein